MKKIYFSFLFGGSIVLSALKTDAQVGSVILTPLAGTSVAYQSIGAAYAAIPASTVTSYTIEILPTYTGSAESYPIQLTDKGLAPGGATITIRPSAGNTGEVIQRVTPADGAVLQFNGGDNIILDGRPGGVASSPANYLTINNPFASSNLSRNIELLNVATNNTIQFINAVAADADATGAGARNILIGSGTGAAVAGNNNNIIQNSLIRGGARGIQDFGWSELVPNSGNIIRNNTIENFGFIGINAGFPQSNITIQGNVIRLDNYANNLIDRVEGIRIQSIVPGNVSNITDNSISLVTASTTVTALYGILDLGVGTQNVLRNTITALSAPFPPRVSGGNFAYGIVAELQAAANGGQPATFNIDKNKISGISSTGVMRLWGMILVPFAGSTVNVTNNFVSIMDENSGSTGIFGIHTVGGDYNTNVYFNSVRIGGIQPAASNSLAIGIVKEDNSAGRVYNQKNNISMMERTGGSDPVIFTAFRIFNANGTVNVDYNTYYSATTFTAGGWNGFVYSRDAAGLRDYKISAGANEQNTNFKNVTFVSNTDLHLAGASLTDAALLGTPIPGITTDIDDNPRNPNSPTQGADESPAILPVDLSTFIGENKGKYNQLSWTTLTENNNSGFEIEQSADGRQFATIGFVKSIALNGNSNNKLMYSFKDEKPLATNTYYRLKQLDKDGRFKHSSVIKVKGLGTKVEITKLYPNPVTTNFNLAINTATSGKLSIIITDLSGKAVIERVITAIAGENLVPLNAASLSSGTYFITVRNKSLNEKVTLQFIK